MGNQQERLAAYLAGVIDGEGWVGVGVRKQRNGTVGFDPHIAVHVVNWDWVDDIDRIAKELGLPSYVSRMKNDSRWAVKGYRRVTRTIPVIRPYLLNKHRQADLLLRLSDLRLDRPYHDGTPTAEEWDIVNQIRALNDKGKNPQRLHAERYNEYRRYSPVSR